MTNLEDQLYDIAQTHLTLFRKVADAVSSKRPIHARTQRDMERMPEIKELREVYSPTELQIALYRVAKDMIANQERA